MITAAPAGRKSKIREIFSNQQTALLLVLFVMIGFFTIMNPIFFSTDVASNILSDWGPLVLVAVAQTFVIISGGIDLSVGSIVTLSSVVGALAIRSLNEGGSSPWVSLTLGLLVCLFIGAIAGAANAAMINYARLVPFIATLVTLGAAAGLAIVITGGGPIGGGPKEAIQLVVPWLGPLSWPLIMVIVVCIVAGLYLHKARFGRHTYALGSNAFATRAAGISTKTQIAKIYILSGALSGMAGMYLYLRLGSGSPTAGFGLELDAIAAVVIGGAALSGGIGRISGTIIGALILTTVTSGLIIIGVAPNWKQVVVALLIAVAVTIQGFRRNESRAS
jgi:ribose transport system permease protein